MGTALLAACLPVLALAIQLPQATDMVGSQLDTVVPAAPVGSIPDPSITSPPPITQESPSNWVVPVPSTAVQVVNASGHGVEAPVNRQSAHQSFNNLTRSSLDKPPDTVVVAHFDESLNWLTLINNQWRVAVVSSADNPRKVLGLDRVDHPLDHPEKAALKAMLQDPRNLMQVENVGNEAFKYLSYILKEYDNLPDVVVFVHGHNDAWHDPDTLKAVYINELDRESLAANGISFFQSSKPLFVGNYTVAPGNPHDKPSDQIMALWADLFEPWLGPLQATEKWTTPCCAQFAVRKERILNRPKAMYAHLYNWILDGKVPWSNFVGWRPEREENRIGWEHGWMLEFMWARLFDGSRPTVDNQNQATQ